MSLALGVHVGQQNMAMDEMRALWRKLQQRSIIFPGADLNLGLVLAGMNRKQLPTDMISRETLSMR